MPPMSARARAAFPGDGEEGKERDVSRGVFARNDADMLCTNVTLDSSTLGAGHRTRSAGFGSGGDAHFSERKWLTLAGVHPERRARRAVHGAGLARRPSPKGPPFHSSDKHFLARRAIRFTRETALFASTSQELCGRVPACRPEVRARGRFAAAAGCLDGAAASEQA